MANAIDITKFKAPWNRRAVQKYTDLSVALTQVGEALDQARKFAGKTADAAPKGKKTHWSVASPDEVKAAVKRADQSLRIISSSARRWEAELISKDWRS